ncbi:hypothetical protein [Pseudodesulfovibrio pelocollis]|uniref:hypothetical protein n=1 Tax=Pseudodesulfovibrio pelocollis TaxID=3051432 RepID=UPI00255AF353|nr:hypothetical protein [Pseudodesulfovibrio sp. SB368]
MNRVIMTGVVALLLLVSIPCFANQEKGDNAPKYANETEAYKASIEAWAQKVAVARTNALNTYHGVRLTVENVVWKKTKDRKFRYAGNTFDDYSILIKLGVVNTSAVNVTISNIFFDFRDSTGRQIKSIYGRQSVDLAPGQRDSLDLIAQVSEFVPNHDPAWDGQLSLQIVHDIHIRDVNYDKGKLAASGYPFVGERPRDPFWLDEKEIKYIVGSAEMEAGVYDQNVEFPARGWWPIPGQNGSFSGTTPGPMAKAQPVIVQEYPSYLQKGTGTSETDEEGNSVEDSVEAVKTTGEAAQSLGRTVRSIKSIFGAF